MNRDPKTLSVYDAQAQEYEQIMLREKTPGLDAFIEAMPKGATVLDFGCGPGLDARAMQDAGMRVDATDGSREMVARAQAQGVNARQAYFEELDEHQKFDGIWANFSLLHLDATDLPGILKKLHRAIKPGGVFHIGMKTGEGAHRDDLGRLYSYYSVDALDQLLDQAGFTPGEHMLGSGRGLDGSISEWVVILSYG